MIFKPCPKCGIDIGPHNTQDIKMDIFGLYFTHVECHGTGFLSLTQIQERAQEKAKGDPFKQLEIEWYQERLKELGAA
jgi:hypothetical protein